MKLFITGVTGYIGGDILYTIAYAHPEYEITALVRNSEKGARVAQEYPRVRLVYGDNETRALIEEETKKADIVMHFANSADDVPGTSAFIEGLRDRPASDKPIHYIHTGGTGILCLEDMKSGTYGSIPSNPHIYNDWTGIHELTSLPDESLHRNVDKIVLGLGTSSLATEKKIRTAIVSPPCIYGKGRGPDNKTSIQLPLLARSTLQLGHGVKIGEGKAVWSFVHVQDLSNLYLLLVEAAEKEKSGEPSTATWGAEGYYFVENGDMAWGEVSAMVAAEAKNMKLIEKDEVVNLSAEEAEQRIRPFAKMAWGANSRSKAIRARKLLGWEARMPGLEEVVRETIQIEAEDMGLIKGHAAIAAGDA